MTSNNSSPTSRLFVGSLPYRYTEGELLSLFIPFGRIIAVKITHTPWGKNRGFGYIEFDNLDCAITAKNQLHDSALEGRRIIVDYALPDPFSTPEGQQRHFAAVKRNPKKFRSETTPDPRPDDRHRPSRPFKKYNRPPSGSSPRQSVYDSRTHHSRVGAKFAQRKKSRH